MARVNTKQLITEAAVRVAARHGISGASMDEIAEEAGVAKGSLYYNFASKDAIFEAIMRDGFERLGAAIDDARATDAQGSDLVRAVAAATLQALRENPELARIMASEVFRIDRPWYGALELARGSVIVRYRDVLREASAVRGGSRADEITETAGAAFFGALAGACLDWLLFRQDQPVEAVLDQVLLPVW